VLSLVSAAPISPLAWIRNAHLPAWFIIIMLRSTARATCCGARRIRTVHAGRFVSGGQSLKSGFGHALAPHLPLNHTGYEASERPTRLRASIAALCSCPSLAGLPRNFPLSGTFARSIKRVRFPTKVLP
jgi:hypothetical protein